MGNAYNHDKNVSHGAVYHALTPRHMLKLWTDYTLPGVYSRWTGVTVKGRHGTSGTARIGGASQDYRIRPGGHAVGDAHVSCRIDDPWQMMLNVNDVFDKPYYSVLGPPTGGDWYGEPRNATLTLRGRF
ncbi:TonB-dependent receptor [Paracoccus versutus]|uniref:TonB-dependent receptor n=1 Tax=Paracoccus versutus TaxID=34007 RepID=UPI00215D665F|nr:TonB-dependent receptor [Paracoccus versutus]